MRVSPAPRATTSTPPYLLIRAAPTAAPTSVEVAAAAATAAATHQ